MLQGSGNACSTSRCVHVEVHRVPGVQYRTCCSHKCVWGRTGQVGVQAVQREAAVLKVSRSRPAVHTQDGCSFRRRRTAVCLGPRVPASVSEESVLRGAGHARASVRSRAVGRGSAGGRRLSARGPVAALVSSLLVKTQTPTWSSGNSRIVEVRPSLPPEWCSIVCPR